MSTAETLTLLFWVLLLLALFVPFFRQRIKQLERFRALRELEMQRGSRVITLIHRQEALSFLGIPLFRFMDIEDSEQILRAIRLTPEAMPIDLIIHTPGGLVLAAEQIAHALKAHRGKICVMVPHYAMSGGTLIALGAHEIRLDENAVLGPVDPQLGSRDGGFYPANSILKVLEQKPIKEIEDSTLILADIARKAINQVKSFIQWLLEDRVPGEKAREIASILAEGYWTHDAPLTVEALREIGLPVETGLPQKVYKLMELYPQSAGRRPSVQYVPIPYTEKGGERKR